MGFRHHALDGALLSFDRITGTNVLISTHATRSLERKAPRTLQIGLLTPCNLRCTFCYRDVDAPSRWTYDELVALCREAAAWGVLEVAFGGGEPLLFKRFPELVEEIHATTPLGVNVTTNGLLLTRELADRLRPALSEIRLSIYDDNDWRDRLRLLRGHSIGANWLVTPESVDLVVPRVLELLRLGARNVLLLGYKGDDAARVLDARGFDRLRRALAILDGLPVRVDVCWYPELRELPYLFARTDCGAGDDSVMLTPDKQVQACSFAKARVPFETLDDVKAIWSGLRRDRPHARTAGCTRDRFEGAMPAERVVSTRVLPVVTPAVFAWQAWASSNSGPYLLITRFPSAAQATKAAGELEQMYQEHLAFVNSDAYGTWSTTSYYEPTPPMQAFAKAHGFTWPAGDGFAWEEMDEGGLEIRAVGTDVVVHIAYGQQIGAQGIALYAGLQGGHVLAGTEQPFVIRTTAKTDEARRAVDRVLGEALDELEDLMLEGDADADDEGEPFEPEYLVELDTVSGTMRVGFGSNIGGQNDVARLLLWLSEIHDLDVRIEVPAR